MLYGNAWNVFKVTHDGTTHYHIDEEIMDIITSSSDEYVVQLVSTKPSIVDSMDMESISKQLYKGEFECYSTCGGYYTSMFKCIEDGGWQIYTVENDYPTHILKWFIPQEDEICESDLYDCIGDCKYLVDEYDLRTTSLPKFIEEIYEYLIKNMSD